MNYTHKIKKPTWKTKLRKFITNEHFIRINNSTDHPILLFITENPEQLIISEINFDTELGAEEYLSIKSGSRRGPQPIQKIIIPPQQKRELIVKSRILYLTACRKNEEYWEILFLNKAAYSNATTDINKFDLICPLSRIKDISIDTNICF